MKNNIIISTVIGLFALSLEACSAIPYAPANDADVEKLQKELDELQKENEELKEAVNQKSMAEEKNSDESEEWKTWSDDMVIEFDDPKVEEAVREQYSIPEGDVTYGMIKSEKSFAIPYDEVEGEYILNSGKTDSMPTSIDSLKYFTGVDTLGICLKEVEDISVIEKMSSLKSLKVSYANSEHLNDIQNCKLDELILSAYQGNDIDGLKNMTSLKKFELRENIYEEKTIEEKLDLGDLEKIPNLEGLVIQSNRADMTFLSGMHSLKSFEFVSNEQDINSLKNPIDLSGLAEIPGLEDLTIRSNCVDISFLSQIHNLKNLVYSADNQDISSLKNFLNYNGLETLFVAWDTYMYNSVDGEITSSSSTEVGAAIFTTCETIQKGISIPDFLDLLYEGKIGTGSSSDSSGKKTEDTDGLYRGSLWASRKDKIGTVDSFGSPWSIVYQVSCEGNQLYVYGSMEYRVDWNHEPVSGSDDIIHVFAVDDNTVFKSGGGEEEPDKMSADEFINYVDKCRDTGLDLEIVVVDGVATQVGIWS